MPDFTVINGGMKQVRSEAFKKYNKELYNLKRRIIYNGGDPYILEYEIINPYNATDEELEKEAEEFKKIRGLRLKKDIENSKKMKKSFDELLDNARLCNITYVEGFSECSNILKILNEEQGQRKNTYCEDICRRLPEILNDTHMSVY